MATTLRTTVRCTRKIRDELWKPIGKNITLPWIVMEEKIAESAIKMLGLSRLLYDIQIDALIVEDSRSTPSIQIDVEWVVGDYGFSEDKAAPQFLKEFGADMLMQVVGGLFPIVNCVQSLAVWMRPDGYNSHRAFLSAADIDEYIMHIQSGHLQEQAALQPA